MSHLGQRISALIDGELADAEQLEPEFSFVERSARGLAGAAEFG